MFELLLWLLIAWFALKTLQSFRGTRSARERDVRPTEERPAEHGTPFPDIEDAKFEDLDSGTGPSPKP